MFVPNHVKFTHSICLSVTARVGQLGNNYDYLLYYIRFHVDLFYNTNVPISNETKIIIKSVIIPEHIYCMACMYGSNSGRLAYLVWLCYLKSLFQTASQCQILKPNLTSVVQPNK